MLKATHRGRTHENQERINKMSLHPPALQGQGHAHGLAGRREAPLHGTAGTGQRPAPAQTVPLGPGQRGGRRGGATACLCRSTASLPAPCSWSTGLRCSSELFRPPPSLTGILLTPETHHTHPNSSLSRLTVMSETRLFFPTEHHEGFGQQHNSSAAGTARAGRWP